ncbi:MAG: pantetheine-phosphate adenylyltransferase [Candidatus Eisenbacteria bacterium]|nr:pantetheine-phosphate adenylyltransferase [Candidatus Eisenbacteria bacterium]
MENARKERRGLFPGTFDPVTKGHLDIIGRALQACDCLTVAVADRHHKQTLFSVEERVALIREALPADWRARVTVKPFTGLLVDFARAEGIRVIVRGLRVVSDFEYEFQMALMNKRLWPDIETLFLMPGEAFIYLNSTLVKEVARWNGPTEQFVTPNVSAALARRFREER